MSSAIFQNFKFDSEWRHQKKQNAILTWVKILVDRFEQVKVRNLISEKLNLVPQLKSSRKINYEDILVSKELMNI